MKFRVLPTITITWKNHENGSHTNKNSTRYRYWHTMVWGESYLYHILITRICVVSHISVCYYLSQPAKTGCFHNSTHYIAQYSYIWKYQFALVNVVCNEGCIFATRRVLGRLWSNISHSNTFEPKFERRKKKE